jgi:hypothetical protein
MLFILGLSISGCYYDSEEALFPALPGSCDTTDVSYAEDIVPILSSRCYMCHSNLSGASLGSNIFLEDHADVTGNATALLGSIKHEASYSPMPKGGGKLSDCSILKTEAWIDQGMPDN